jgi:hypothetical protein
MPWPKFWHDRGSWNDAVVTGAIAVALAAAGAVLYVVQPSWWPSLAIVLSAPIAGLALGLGVVAVLGAWFGKK